MGLLLLAFGISTVDGTAALLFYLMAYVFMNMGAFMVAEVVEGDEMSDWGGLSGRSPALAFAMLMFLLSLGGIPFVAGFWAKIFLFMAAWKAGATGLVILGAMLSVVALYYYMQVGRSIYIEDAPKDRTDITIGRATAWAIWAVRCRDHRHGRDARHLLVSRTGSRPCSGRRGHLAERSTRRPIPGPHPTVRLVADHTCPHAAPWGTHLMVPHHKKGHPPRVTFLCTTGPTRRDTRPVQSRGLP